MTTLVVPAAPPRAGLVCASLPESTPLSGEEAADLYAAALQDTLRAAEKSGGDLLVNVRSEETIPEEFHTDTDPEAEVRAVAGEALADVTAVRFEPQVGSTRDARVGNTVTHLLREEGADSVAVIRPIAPLVRRSTIDSGVMKLRSEETVLGPTATGGVYFTGFTDTIQFGEAFTDPAVETLTDRSVDADNGVDFLPTQTTIDSATGLAGLIPILRGRVTAERVAPTETATFVHEAGLRARDGEVVRDD